ncbi:hypothetical protein C3486_02110 [Streptomyces sp. Ru73]|uniref:hypothetical protein n=1 Tax=Streptomyces sp. Ru73 TaxID=2080748 RepID=UPI000CDE46BA|nr:hypothetical protein [Streptomyces sp. Ru73]POX43037.1 hypothetical protein C3486_02110 [Streptomyces sp. Ru73]
MKERELRRRCKRELRALDIHPPLRVGELCQQLGERRGRPIRLVPHRMPVPGPFGAWIATPAADYILYQQETTASHQRHIILHEVGHILADHQSEAVDDDELCAGVPNLAPGSVRRLLRRTSYDEEHEREAELVATIVLEWASVLDRVAPRPASDPSLRRVQTALGDRQGWL